MKDSILSQLESILKTNGAFDFGTSAVAVGTIRDLIKQRDSLQSDVERLQREATPITLANLPGYLDLIQNGPPQ